MSALSDSSMAARCSSTASKTSPARSLRVHALLGFRPLLLALSVEFRPSPLCNGVPLSRLFRRALLSDLPRLDGILDRGGLGAHRDSVCGAFQAGFRGLGACCAASASATASTLLASLRSWAWA